MNVVKDRKCCENIFNTKNSRKNHVMILNQPVYVDIFEEEEVEERS